VGVVDTGIDNTHADLAHVKYGKNTAKGKPESLWQDIGHRPWHGWNYWRARFTSTRPGTGIELCSSRAFPKDSLHRGSEDPSSEDRNRIRAIPSLRIIEERRPEGSCSWSAASLELRKTLSQLSGYNDTWLRTR
jgi:hypothetical protein